ncbi:MULTISPECIES: hypothetical protein [Campylobacter]|uniref:YopX protein domain-containing protein n=1 Tax=Campylobacter vicugnae TaxID=1660076 RepID=A0ABZ2E7H8_9BACT|nr:MULTISPECIES: hypothetical protein [unclassified Campylobacter]ARR04678.1 hypothetical protein CVIC12175_1586 [Campylobacter sp. RM12175]MCR8690537.1 hypothetical protein [Campylobacter sp. RM9264]MCR8701409.1 hypothetical protein [Campylobacter sp. RM12176]
MINAKFKAGKYYIGDLAKILDYSNLSILELGFGILDEFKYLNFELECDEITDNSRFIYSVDSSNFGIISAKIIDEELLSSRILTLKNGFVANKFSGYSLARIVDFKDEFEVAICDNKITFGNIILNL